MNYTPDPEVAENSEKKNNGPGMLSRLMKLALLIKNEDTRYLGSKSLLSFENTKKKSPHPERNEELSIQKMELEIEGQSLEIDSEEKGPNIYINLKDCSCKVCSVKSKVKSVLKPRNAVMNFVSNMHNKFSSSS